MARGTFYRSMILALIAFSCSTTNFIITAVAKTQDETWEQLKILDSKKIKEILKELEITFDESDSEQELRELAYDEDALEQWLLLHPKEKQNLKAAVAKRKDEGPPPTAVEKELYEQMENEEKARKGDFSMVKDPEKRRILTKVKSFGMDLQGGMDMSLERLQGIEKMIDNNNFPGMPGFEL